MRLEFTGLFVKNEPEAIPDLAFMFCLLNYRDRFSPGSTALSILEVYQKECSPGRVLGLEEYQVRFTLEGLHSAGLIQLEKFANLDQVRFSSTLSQEEILSLIYGRQEINGCL